MIEFICLTKREMVPGRVGPKIDVMQGICYAVMRNGKKEAI